MNKLTTFFRTLFKSSTSPAYYPHILKAPQSYSWKYFFALNLLVTLLLGLQILIPVALFDAMTNLRSLASVVPSDLVVTGDQDGLHINQETPYFIGFPEQLVEKDQENDLPSYVAVFTTDEDIKGILSVEEYDSLFVITPSTLYVAAEQDEREIRAYPIPDFEEPFTIDQPTVAGYLDRIANHPVVKYKLYLVALLSLVLAVLYPLILIGRLLALVLFATTTWVITTLFMNSKKLSWGQIFQITQHSITPSIVLGNVFSVLSWVFFTGGLYFLVYLGWTLYVISQLSPTKRVVEGEVVSRPVASSVSRSKTRGAKSATRKKSAKK